MQKGRATGPPFPLSPKPCAPQLTKRTPRVVAPETALCYPEKERRDAL